MRQHGRILFASFSLLLALVVAAAAGGDPVTAVHSPERLKARVVVEGRITCIGCAVKAADPLAEPECTLYAKHAQGLAAPDGTIFAFLDNTKGHPLVADPKWAGKEARVLGWKHAKAQAIEVSKFEIKDGEKWVAYDFCKSCGFEPGDNKDADLCEDCRE